MGADVPEPAWGGGRRTVRTSLWVKTLGSKWVLLFLSDNLRRWKEVWGMEADNAKENTGH